MRIIVRILILWSGLGLLSACGGDGGSGSTGGGIGSATQLSLSGPTNSGAGIAFSFTVTALGAANNVAAGYAGMVHFTSTDPAAVLPPDSTLVSGTKTFSATLRNAGLQIVTVSDATASVLKGSLAITVVEGVYPVSSFGAKGDGHTDDTAAIQSTINAASAAGGGSVLFSVARYFTSGTFVVPKGVVLSGMIEGPFDPWINPAATSFGPTLLVTNASGPFLTLQGVGAGVTDLLFHYPNQVAVSAAAPLVYPYTILVTAPGAKVLRSTVTNAYDFLDIEAGRSIAEELFIGAFHNDIHVDHAYGHVTLRHLTHTVYWDIVLGQQYPQPIDTWVLNHGTALMVGRVDSLEVHDFFVFSRFTGMLLTDSLDASQNPTCGYGTGSDIDIEGVQYGIAISASNTPGYKFTNLFLESQAIIGQAAVQVRSGGSMPPKILINGVSQGGPNPWVIGAFPPPPAGAEEIVAYPLP